MARFVSHGRSFGMAQRRGGATWSDCGAVGDCRLAGDTKTGDAPDRKTIGAPCRNAVGSHKSRHTARRYGQVCHH
jgi:hypothetical protein